jgi:uncharacterized protein YndB with AHSA1/START domain
MKVSVEFSTEVQASAEKLWVILTDVEVWPDWQGTTFIKLTKPGSVVEGSAFIATLGGMKWNLVMTKAERPHKIIWAAKRFGLNAIHEWEFKEEAGKTRVTTRENMTGWLLFLTYPIARKRLAAAEEKWLDDLKTAAES